MNIDLIRKYNVPGPRYTSYPTVPYWDESFFGVEAWIDGLKTSFSESNAAEGVSIYIHLPFCESLCTFCGCFKRITKNHGVEKKYVQALLKEWRLYCSVLETRPVIRELHLGGGTPTFFSVENLEDLINGIFAFSERADTYTMSFEGHPNNTTKEHLEKLFSMGFRRVSFGVQDYNETVQVAINRVQLFAQVEKVTSWAREIGYASIGHDIVYGLPFSTAESLADTVQKTISLQPDTLSFYSYAHVPWVKGNGQRGFQDADIPVGETKQHLYETGKRLLISNGYVEIGMDHFSIQTDALYQAHDNGTLHRNFMGYTPVKTKAMIGLGVSAISDSWYGFAQNVKNLDDYYQMLEWGVLPVVKGHLLSSEDLVVRQHILNLMCRFETSWAHPDMQFEDIESVVSALSEMIHDGLVSLSQDALQVTEKGRPFLRNICMAFDLRLLRSQPRTQTFSMTI